MRALVVEENVGAECAQEFALVETPEEQCLVDTDVPRTQGANDALVRRCAARGHECGANRTLVIRKVRLDAMQSGEKVLERPAGKRLERGRTLALGKGGEAFR